MDDLEPTFGLIMRRLGVAGSAALVDRIVKPVELSVPAPETLRDVLAGKTPAVAVAGTREVYEQIEGE